LETFFLNIFFSTNKFTLIFPPLWKHFFIIFFQGNQLAPQIEAPTGTTAEAGDTTKKKRKRKAYVADPVQEMQDEQATILGKLGFIMRYTPEPNENWDEKKKGPWLSLESGIEEELYRGKK
jgi:hypothetical protein